MIVDSRTIPNDVAFVLIPVLLVSLLMVPLMPKQRYVPESTPPATE